MLFQTFFRHCIYSVFVTYADRIRYNFGHLCLGAPYPFQVSFQGESGVDTGGLSREAFSTFWELTYQKHFDGSSSFTPVVSTCIDSATLQALGRVLSFGYIVCGFLPLRISFPLWLLCCCTHHCLIFLLIFW